VEYLTGARYQMARVTSSLKEVSFLFRVWEASDCFDKYEILVQAPRKPDKSVTA
jgi:hypothetical protein